MLDLEAFRDVSGYTKIMMCLNASEKTEWTCPPRLFIKSRQGGLSTGYYNCVVPQNDGQPRCYLEFWHKYQLGWFAVPSIVLPLAVVAMYAVWYIYFRKAFLAGLLHENNDSPDVWEKSSDGESKGLARMEKSSDEEAQKMSQTAPSRLFRYSKSIFEGWYSGYCYTQLLPSILEQRLPTRTLNAFYAQQILAMMLEGLLFKPQSRPLAVTLGAAWGLLSLRGLLVAFSFESTILMTDTTFNVGLLLLVYLFIPFRFSIDKAATTITLLSGASLIGHVSMHFLDPSLTSAMTENQSYLQFFILGRLVPALSLLAVWNGIQYSKSHAHVPVASRFSGMVRELLVTELPSLAFCCFTALLCFGAVMIFWAVTSFLTSCIGFPRLLFGLSPNEPTLYDCAGFIAATIWTYVFMLPLVPYLDNWGPRRYHRVGIGAIEAVPKTLAVLLAIGALLVGLEWWGKERNVIYPQAAWYRQVSE